MKHTSHRSPISRAFGLALLALLAASVATPAMAQIERQSMREKRDAAREKARQQEEASAEQPQLFPNATRTSPEAKAEGRALEKLQELQELYVQKDYAGALARAQEIAADSDAGSYAQGFAYQVAGYSAGQLGDKARAAGFFEKAVATGALDNNNHYQAMYNLAAAQYEQKQFQQALATIDRVLSETGTDNPAYHGLRGSILANLGRGEEAAQIYAEQLAEHPNDKQLLMKAAAAYQQAGQADKATALLAQAHGKGLFTTADEYRMLYRRYINGDKRAEALAVIDDGLAKGVLQADPELAREYSVLAQKAFYAGDDAAAISLYQRAAPIAADGETYLNLAKVLDGMPGRSDEAREAAQKALDKGVEDEADARDLLGAPGN